MLDSPALIDLNHGTVRYRHPDEKREQDNTKIKTGYFYHPRLDDFSEGIDPKKHLLYFKRNVPNVLMFSFSFLKYFLNNIFSLIYRNTVSSFSNVHFLTKSISTPWKVIRNS